MLVAAAVSPCPPLLVPEVAAGAAPELDPVRAACAEALAVLARARPDLLIVVGPAEEGGRGAFPSGSAGDFLGFGVDLGVRLGPEAPDGDASSRPLPASLTVGAWLLAEAGWTASPVEGLGVGEPLSPERCAEAGRGLAEREGRVALLVMGDGSACRTVKAPGYLDPRAEGFDAVAFRALGEADVRALAELDAPLAYALKAAGRAPWQVLAGAADGAGLAGRSLYEDAPYGVGYTVAAWS
ncbi:class III extradiol dioxygenase subunit B-like domain-containing protein [Streptomyces sp. NBC_00102]|uniref:class III extradiol dioxygenase subunit B-like domain-containing protein n=1 Tax=Streptomyces sp. NBC_00102 TaxID=2975652 RepID=UPI00224D99E1|nr:class III extradiol dioxygenase subunit B-like domain-containing protein [Streptomyces sp. NBC_00102]MCX5400193.1 class III extradiol dioxygenase subunit B-like domain-containing protein [Streptomyces sp. NBC_00102]